MESIHDRCGFVSIIDLGGRKEYWNCVSADFLRRVRATITILNLPGEVDMTSREDGPFVCVEGDACNLAEFEDNSFHIVHSNSVIEHVGNWEKVTRFAHEVRRLAPNYYVQTPNFWFPVEPHFMKPFFHFLPQPIQVELVRRFDMGHFIKARSVGEAMLKLEGINLFDKNMFCEVFPDATLVVEKYMFLTKSLIAYRERE